MPHIGERKIAISGTAEAVLTILLPDGMSELPGAISVNVE
jgi:hypothetical protein